MSEIDWILKRRSIRQFTEQEVTSDQITLLLEAAMAAPSAMNLKPWKFVVVTSEERLNQLRKALLLEKWEHLVQSWYAVTYDRSNEQSRKDFGYRIAAQPPKTSF